jgi:putative SOS response-associated peptidase YedK
VETEGLTTIARPLTTIRSDALRNQPEWRRLLNAQRCVVPAEQFFEWKRVDDIKTREFCIKLKSGKPMMIAGLWNRSDSYGESFAYISCQANPLVSLIHDQMPVMLDQAAISAWFNPDATLEHLLSFLKPARVDEIELTAVAKSQNTQRPNQPSLFDREAA